MDWWREKYGSRNIGLLSVHPPEAADRPRQFNELEYQPDLAIGGI